MTAFLSILGRLLGSNPSESTYQTSNVYEGLRTQILELKTEQLNVSRHQAVLAVVMETGYAKGVTTLVAILDGTASLYFSNGGGIIGAGENPGPRAAARELVTKSADFLSTCTRAEAFPLPRRGYTRFYVITPKGVFTSEVKEDDLRNDRHRMSALFRTAHNLIKQIKNRNAESSGSENVFMPRLWICHSMSKTLRHERENGLALASISNAK